LLTLSASAHASLLGDSVVFDWGDGVAATSSPAVVADPGVEWVDVVIPGWDPFEVNVDVTANTWRIDFISEFRVYSGADPGLFKMFALVDLDPVCADGSTGTVTGVTTIGTNVLASQWLPEQVDWDDNAAFVMADPVALDGDSEFYMFPGDFIELELEFSCPDAAPELSIGGDCPGPQPVDVTGMTPGGSAGIIASSFLGGDSMLGGPCASVATGLTAPFFVTTVYDWDGDGEYHFTPATPGGACGRYIQFVDITTCAMTNAASF
jgi:hypothetical protein